MSDSFGTADFVSLTHGEQNPSEWSGQLLLGLEALNASKNPELSEDERIQELMIGSKLIERAFNSNQRNASAANALCDIFLRKGQHKRVRWFY